MKKQENERAYFSIGGITVQNSQYFEYLREIQHLNRPEKVAGIIGIAPAVDMTKRALSNLTAEAKRELSETGAWMRPSKYDAQGYPITKKLLDEGELHLLLPGPINFQGPVRILHGMRDDAVPWELSLEIARPEAKIKLMGNFSTLER